MSRVQCGLCGCVLLLHSKPSDKTAAHLAYLRLWLHALLYRRCAIRPGFSGQGVAGARCQCCCRMCLMPCGMRKQSWSGSRARQSKLMSGTARLLAMRSRSATNKTAAVHNCCCCCCSATSHELHTTPTGCSLVRVVTGGVCRWRSCHCGLHWSFGSTNAGQHPALIPNTPGV